jgi:hypothetical protein
LFSGFVAAAAATLREGDQHPLPLSVGDPQQHNLRAWVAVGL